MRLTKGNPYLAAVVLVVVVAALITAAIAVNLSDGLPFNLSLGGQDYTLSAVFTDANGVNPGANVVIAGAEVGQVTGIRISHGKAVVTMRVGHKYGPLHRGTVAAIRYSTLLADKYVELTPASGTPALPSGATIPSTETVTPVDFDQFLSSLDARTRQQVQVLVQQLGGGVTGEEAAINALLDNLATLSEQSPPTLDVLKARDPQLASILDSLDVVASRLASSHQQLGQLVGNTADVTQTLARTDTSLDGLLVHLANVSQDTSQTLRGNEANLKVTIERLDPFLVDLNPNLATAAKYLTQASPTLQAEARYLIPEVVSAISQQDAGGNYLREFVVVNTCYGTLDTKPAKPVTNSLTGGCTLQAITGLTNPATSAPKPEKPAKHAGPCPSATPSPSPLLNLPRPSPSPSSSCATPQPGTTSPSPSPTTPKPTSPGLLGPLSSLFGGL
jgi:phospholipid/cholesterol/gamma-HCH transport system substrate-binding protein